MPRFETTRPVRHSCDVMFDLVADVERYPEFVPMCESLFVKRRSEASRSEGDGSIPVTTLLADMAIGYKMIRETFTTRVELDPANSQIRVTYVDGPFKHLENRWTFVRKDSSTLASASREPGATSLADASKDSASVASPDAKPATTFAGDASGCDVKFFIDYEFRSRTFQMLAGAVFEKVFRKMAEAFEARADALAAKRGA